MPSARSRCREPSQGQGKASEDAGHKTTPELTTFLQERIADALFKAGYSGDAP